METSKKMHSVHVMIPDSKLVRRLILESARDATLLAKQYDDFAILKAEKDEVIERVNTSIKKTQLAVNKFSSHVLPKIEETGQKTKPQTQEQEPTIKKATAPKSMNKFDLELDAINKKLKEL